MFHVAFDGSLQAGTPVSQGQPIGTISGSGGPGFAGTPHLHFTLWTSGDNGNWDREAQPFTGKYAIAGMDFPDVGGNSQYAGTTFNP
jgi:murein DD-endopeptidase MepM/ murein hydrolase activator NlpD